MNILYVMSAVILALAGVFYLCGDVYMTIAMSTIGGVAALGGIALDFSDRAKW